VFDKRKEIKKKIKGRVVTNFESFVHRSSEIACFDECESFFQFAQFPRLQTEPKRQKKKKKNKTRTHCKERGEKECHCLPAAWSSDGQATPLPKFAVCPIIEDK
jgi:hypothetical protein